MKMKVKSADARTIVFDKGITLGADKHPQFFTVKSGFRVPTLKVGEEVDIPDEAICISETSGNKYVISGVMTLENMQMQEVKLGIQLKKKLILNAGA